MTPPNRGPRLIDANTVSEMTGFAVCTIQRMARQGRIPAVKVGRLVRFRTADIEAWLTKLPKAAS